MVMSWDLNSLKLSITLSKDNSKNNNFEHFVFELWLPQHIVHATILKKLKIKDTNFKKNLKKISKMCHSLWMFKRCLMVQKQHTYNIRYTKMYMYHINSLQHTHISSLKLQMQMNQRFWYLNILTEIWIWLHVMSYNVWFK